MRPRHRAAHAIELTTPHVVNDILGDDAGFTIAAGAAFGDTLATRAGSQGDSELLFLGDAANHGAKAIKKSNRLRVTEGLVSALGDELPDLDLGEADGIYQRATLKQSDVEAAVDKYKLSWSLDNSRDRVQSDADSITVDAFTVKKATSDIDKSSLGRSNSKLNDAVTLFGDVDGFTAMVEGASSDTAKANLLRLFQVLRKELRSVCVTDFGTLRVQYQGDRIQGLRHLAHDNAEDRALRSVRLAAGWQSSMEEVIATRLRGSLVLTSRSGSVGSDAGQPPRRNGQPRHDLPRQALSGAPPRSRPPSMETRWASRARSAARCPTGSRTCSAATRPRIATSSRASATTTLFRPKPGTSSTSLPPPAAISRWSAVAVSAMSPAPAGPPSSAQSHRAKALRLQRLRDDKALLQRTHPALSFDIDERAATAVATGPIGIEMPDGSIEPVEVRIEFGAGYPYRAPNAYDARVRWAPTQIATSSPPAACACSCAASTSPGCMTAPTGSPKSCAN